MLNSDVEGGEEEEEEAEEVEEEEGGGINHHQLHLSRRTYFIVLGGFQHTSLGGWLVVSES